MAIRKSSSSGTPFGTTENRPASPAVGQTYFNGTLGYLEIYTSSGWIPATGANDFSLNLSGTNTAITFAQSYSSGSYSIISFGNDLTVDVYAYAADGSVAGYTNTKSFTASQRFNKMVVLGGTSGDVLSFSYKTTYATSTSDSDVTAGPYITSISPSGMPNVDSTITVTGGNFASNITASFTGTGYSSTAAKSIVRSSSTSLIVTRPDNFPTTAAPYALTVTNPSVANQPTGSNVHVFSGITAGSPPIWQTAATINSTFYANTSTSLSLSATDADGGSAIAYSYVSGSLPTGLSFNSSTGVISGTPTVVQSATYIVRATDSGGNTADRTFTITVNPPVVSGGTLASDATYYYRTFTGNGNFVVSNAPLIADVLVIAAGGGGGNNRGGGGGAGGVLYTASQTLAPATYTCSIAGGGSAYTNGGSSSFIGGSVSLTGIGGGRGADDSQQFGSAGGSGGGSWAYSTTAGGAGTAGPPRQGFNGGAGGNSNGAGGGGGAAAVGGNGTSNGGNGGAATSAYSSWATATSTGVSGAYAGGGGGGKDSNNASAGVGGGGGAGNGNFGQNSGGSSATANTGSGGGGGGGTSGVSSAPGGASGPGGSGIVIVRYTKASVGG